MIRIDRIIGNQTNYTRKEIKELIKQKRIKVNNRIVNKNDIKIDQDKDIIFIDDQELNIKNYV